MTFTQDVDWDVGDEIVIASSNFDFLEAEQRTIVAVSWRMITLDRPLLHHHHGALGPETLGQFTAETRAEVRALNITQEAISVTQRDLNVTQRALSITTTVPWARRRWGSSPRRCSLSVDAKVCESGW